MIWTVAAASVDVVHYNTVFIIIILLGHDALVAQRPIAIKLSRGWSVAAYMRRLIGLFGALWKMADRIGSGCRLAS